MKTQILFKADIDTEGFKAKIEGLKGGISDLTVEQTKLDTSTKEGAAAFVKNDAAIRKLTSESKKYERVLKDLSMGSVDAALNNKTLNDSLDAEVKSINQARASNKKLLAIRNDLNLSTDEGSDAQEKINDQIEKNNEFIKTNVGALEKQKINIGNYSSALSGAESASKGANNKTVDLTASFEDMHGEMKPLTNRMGEMEDRLYELAQAGDMASDEFKQLTAEAGRLKKAQQDVDLAVDSAATTMGQKLGGAASFAAGSLEVVVGGMTAMGVESEEAEQAIAGVVGAMAVTDGVETMRESFHAVKDLGRAIKSSTIFQKLAAAAQWLWNAALNANPIGLIVMGVGALITAGYGLLKLFQFLTKDTDNSAEANIRKADSLKELEKQQRKNSAETKKASENELDLARASGASKDAIRALERAIAGKNITAAEELKLTRLRIVEQEKLALVALRNADADSEELEAQEERLETARKGFKEAIKLEKEAHEERKELTHKYAVEDATEKTRAEDEQKASRKTARNNKKADNDKDKETAKQKLIDDAKIIEDSQKKAVEMEAEHALQMAEAAFREDDLTPEQLAEKGAALAEAQQGIYDVALEALKEDFNNKLISQEEYDISVEMLKDVRDEKNIERQEVLDADQDERDAEQAEKDKIKGDKEIEGAEFVAAAKAQIRDQNINSVADGVALLASLDDKNKGLQIASILAANAAQIAKTVIATQAANAVITAEGLALSIPTLGASVVTAAGLVASNNISAGISIGGMAAAAAKGVAGLNKKAERGISFEGTLQGASHANGGIDLGNGVEAEGGENMYVSGGQTHIVNKKASSLINRLGIMGALSMINQREGNGIALNVPTSFAARGGLVSTGNNVEIDYAKLTEAFITGGAQIRPTVSVTDINNVGSRMISVSDFSTI